MKTQKTFAFDLQGQFLLARISKDWAIRSVNRLGLKALYFTEDEVKKGKHTKLFKELKKHCV